MAKMQMVLPTGLIKDFERLYDSAEEIFGEMTTAGAEVAMQKIISGSPVPEMWKHVKLTKVYRTPSDGGINTKVHFYGYFPFTGGRNTFSRRNRSGKSGKVYTTDKGIPADFIARVFEYGRSDRPFPKKPFVRKAFSKKDIEDAMNRKFEELTGVKPDE